MKGKGKASTSASDVRKESTPTVYPSDDEGDSVHCHFEDLGEDLGELRVDANDDDEGGEVFTGGRFSKEEAEEMDEIIRRLVGNVKCFGKKYN